MSSLTGSQQLPALLALATELLVAGRFADAIAPLSQAAQLQPSDALIQHDLGLAYLEVGRVPEAIAAFERAVVLHPRYTDAYFRLGIALEKLGETARAIMAYDHATQLLPSLTEAWFRAGALVYLLGHRGEAIGCFRRAAETGGNSSFGRLGKARALLTEDRNQEAEQVLRHTLALDPSNAIAHDLLGNLLTEYGRFDEARALFERAIQLAPLLAGSYYELVRCRPVTKEEGLPEVMEAALATPALEAPQRLRVHLALGEVLQNYITFGADAQGSYNGIAYSPDGKHLMFSQDSSNVTIANVTAEGLLTDGSQVKVAPNNAFIQCFPNSPPAAYANPCGTFYTPSTAYPGGLAISEDGTSAYALLNQNNTLAKIDLTAKTPIEGTEIRVGNAPHSVVLSPNGTTAYVSNEGGRAATNADFQINSAGTEIVANPVTGGAITGTVSVVDLPSMKVTATIPTGLHPTGMAFYNGYLLVTNTYSDTISVIDTNTNEVRYTVPIALPIGIPGHKEMAYGAAPVAIAVDAKNGIGYVACYNANAIAVLNLNNPANPILGAIPVAYAPMSVALDTANNQLIVANDKGVGTLYSFETDHGVTDYNTHQDNGTVSIVPLSNPAALAAATQQVYVNNHWDLTENIQSAAGGNQDTAAVAVPAKIGDPSLIKHVFVIIRENRTYDQILGDVAAGNGDSSLAVFGGKDTPNVHNLVTRFPLLDNFYDPSRQSADGHQWITEALAPFADDGLQSPDWVRSYPGGNAGDALAYQKKGFLFSEASAAGLPVKMYGEYVENDTFKQPNGSTAEPSWSQFYADSQKFEAGLEPTLYYQNTVQAQSSVPAVYNHLITNFPQFDLGIPDQFRVDIWNQDFQKDVAAGTVPSLSMLWVMCDHTGGPPTVDAEQADNDLAVGRIIDYISHSNIWSSSAIFIEEDDSQNGVDHVDGHRSPGYIVSPYAVQNGPTDHTYYTQVNMTRTIEQILGLPPMNQFDLVASPMRTSFVTGTAPAANFLPWTHVPNQVALDLGVTTTTAADKTMTPTAKAMKTAWLKKKQQVFAGKLTRPDAEDPETVNHLNWYMSTGFTRPYPGESKVLPPTAFTKKAPAGDLDD